MSTLTDRLRGVLGTAARTDRERTNAAKHEAPADTVSAATAPADLAAVLGGDWHRVDGTACFVVETRVAPAVAHGAQTVRSMAAGLEAAAHDAWLLVGSRALSPFVFFDLETTGLSGGAGTYAFLVGCGRFDEGGGFVIRQHLLVRFADERSLLALVAGDLGQAGTLVTFNGKSFDAPVLETRYLFHRLDWIGGQPAHLDMLHAARRFWRGPGDNLRRGSYEESRCSLAALEREILGTPRHGDLPSLEIPSRYFHFVRTGDPRPLRSVFEHNRLDLLSLAALTTRILHLVRGGPDVAGDAREALALGRTYAQGGLNDRARQAYARAIELSAGGSVVGIQPSAIYVDALRQLARVSRRSRSHGEAARCWERVLAAPGCPPHVAREASEALAIHHEHRVRDLDTAKTFALRGLGPGAQPAWTAAVMHRLARLDQKINNLRWEAPRLEFG